MNEQMAFLRNVISTASGGNDAAVRLLRTICRTAADQAPAGDLIRVAQFLYDLRDEAARQHVLRN